MRIKHTIWKVSNGYLLVPEDCDTYLQSKDAGGCAVFKTLKEFSEWQPVRKRNRKPKKVSNETFQKLKGTPEHANP